MRHQVAQDGTIYSDVHRRWTWWFREHIISSS